MFARLLPALGLVPSAPVQVGQKVNTAALHCHENARVGLLELVVKLKVA